MPPAVSVVIPAYRAEKTIGACLSGVVLQTVEDLDVVVVDDGSDDGTADLVLAHKDPRIRLIRQPNGGVAAARNRGVAAAAADLVAFCDADDMWFPTHLHAALNLIGDRQIVTSNAHWTFDGGIRGGWLRHIGSFPPPEAQRRAILEQNFVSTMSVFPRAMFDEIGPFDETLTRAEDWDFWLRAIYAGYRVVHQPRPLALYRWTDASLSSDATDMDRCIHALLAKALAGGRLQGEEERYVERRLRGREPRELIRAGDQAVREKRFRDAAAAYRGAAALLPSDRRLVLKSRILSVVPALTGPVVRRRMVGRERAVGFSDGHVR